MDVNPPSVINTFILGESANTNNIVSLRSFEDWGLNNQIFGYNLYVHSPTVFYHSLTISVQSLATCTNVMTTTRNSVTSSNVVYIAQCDNKFVLPVLPIAENLQRCDRALCTTCKGKEVPYDHSYNDEWFLDSSVSMSQTSFGHISINSLTILTVSKATKSP